MGDELNTLIIENYNSSSSTKSLEVKFYYNIFIEVPSCYWDI